MRDRHWLDLAEKAKVNIPLTPEKRANLTLQQLVDAGLVEAVEVVEKVAEKAGKEFGIETALDKMAKAWEHVQLIIEPYRDTGTCILKGVKANLTQYDLLFVNKFFILL